MPFCHNRKKGNGIIYHVNKAKITFYMSMAMISWVLKNFWLTFLE